MRFLSKVAQMKLLAPLGVIFMAWCIPHTQAIASEGTNQLVDGCRLLISITSGASDSSLSTNAALWMGKCSGILEVAVDLGPRLTERLRYCPPGEATYQQAAKVFVRFVDAHPERLHEIPLILALDSLRAAWPCQNQNKPPPKSN
jgi:hypothetical protein